MAAAFMGGVASLAGCRFLDNTIFPHLSGAAVLKADVTHPHGVAGISETKVRLEGCTFSGNGPSMLPTLLAENRGANDTQAVFYSDSSSASVCTYEGPVWNSTSSVCEISSPKALASTQHRTHGYWRCRRSVTIATLLFNTAFRKPTLTCGLNACMYAVLKHACVACERLLPSQAQICTLHQLHTTLRNEITRQR